MSGKSEETCDEAMMARFYDYLCFVELDCNQRCFSIFPSCSIGLVLIN